MRVLRWSKLGPRTIAVGRDDGAIDLIACVEPTAVMGKIEPARFEVRSKLRGHSGAVTDLDWVLGGGELASASLDGDVRQGLATSSLKFCDSWSVYLCTIAASTSLAWPLVPVSAQPDCLRIVSQCTCTHSLHSTPWRGHSLPLQLNLSGRA